MISLEQFRAYVQQNWPQIVEYALLFIQYFLIALYNNKVGSTKRCLNVMFKEKAQVVADTDKALRNDINRDREHIKQELEKSKAAYQAAVNEIKDLRVRLQMTEDVLRIMTADIDTDVIEEVENNG